MQPVWKTNGQTAKRQREAAEWIHLHLRAPLILLVQLFIRILWRVDGLLEVKREARFTQSRKRKMLHCFALTYFYFSSCHRREAEAALWEPNQAERMRHLGGDRARGGGSLHRDTV